MEEVKLTKEIVQGLFEVLERIYYQAEDQEDKLAGVAMFSEKLVEDGFLSESEAEVFNARLLRAKNNARNVKNYMRPTAKVLEDKLEK
jgi:hypothetical protein